MTDHTAPDSSDELKEQYRGEPLSILEIATNPTDAPLATVAMMLVTTAFGYHVYETATEHGQEEGIAVAVTGCIAYYIATRLSRIQNEIVATELAQNTRHDI